MERPSGLFQAGTILLLVGAILAAIGALFMLALAIGMNVLFTALDEPDAPGLFFAIFYGALAIVMAAGSVFGFIGYGKGREGDAQGAFVFGLVAALVPPVQVVPLVGAILCKVSPEAQPGQDGV